MWDLLNASLALLDDACPPDPAAYLCRIEDADDGSACQRCWRRYLFAVANGQYRTDERRDTHGLHQGSCRRSGDSGIQRIT